MSTAQEKVESFFSGYPVRKYGKGQILILEGDEPKHIYLLVKGSVKQSDISHSGEEIVLNLFKPGAYFPMNFALNGGFSPYSFEADTDIEVRRAPSEEVVEFLSANPDVLMDLLSRLYRGVDALLGRTVQLAGGSASSRLVYEIILTAKRFGVGQDKKYTIDISEKDLAARAGLSRETVSRTLAKLKKQGLATFESGQITIPDISLLEKTGL